MPYRVHGCLVCPGGLPGAWPCELEVGVAVGVVLGRLARVEPADGVDDGVGLGLVMLVPVGELGVGDGPPLKEGPGVGPACAPADDSGGAGRFASLGRVSGTPACLAGRSSAGRRAGAITPGSDTPESRLTPTSASAPISRAVMLRTANEASRARDPR